jgi:hypothetical protein
MSYEPAPKPPVRPRSNGYVKWRLVFIFVWLTVMLFPSGTPTDVSRFSSGALLIIVIFALAITYVPPIIAAVQIYRAYKATRH